MPTASSETATTSSPMQKLLEIQRDLKVEKGQYNSFGKYMYRSKEDILEAAKPLCHARGLALVCNDQVEEIGGWKYIISTATLFNVETGEAFLSATGLAREPETKKGMDGSQITGTAASYAGKRALGNLFALDDTKDADAGHEPTPEKQPPAQGPFVAHCVNCGTRYQFADAAQYEQFVASAACCPSPHWLVD